MSTPQLSSNGLRQQVYRAFGEYLRRDPIVLNDEDSLRDDLGLDSLQTIELVYQVESEFDLQIPDEDFGRLQTIGDVVSYLHERIGVSHNHVATPLVPTKVKESGHNTDTNSKSRSRSKTSLK